MKPVKRGDKITVTAVENPKCSFNPTVVDTGPNYNKIHKLVDISIPAAQAMHNCLNKKWKICRKYDDSIVNVAIMTRVDCLKLPGGPCL